MDLLQLKYFCRAASTESFAQAAQDFCVPASNISQCIRRLEKELGAPLFDRSPNRIRLNARGKSFYQSIQQAMELIDDATNEITNSVKRSIKIGHAQGRIFVLRMLDNYMSQFPEIEVSTHKYGPNETLQNFDLILSAEKPDPEGFSSKLVLREPMILIAPKGVLPETEHMSLELLREQPFITADAKTHMCRNTISICEALGFTPRIALRLEYTDFVPKYVSQGFGVALLPYQSWFNTFDEETMDFRVIPDCCRDLYMYRKKQRGSAPHIDHFCSMLQKVFDRMQETSPHYPPLLLR